MRVRRLVMFVAQSSATVELLAGDILAAERELRSALAFARELEERDSLSQAAARLSLVLRMQGRSEEGADLAVLSEQAAPSESVAAQALSRAAVARSASDAGEHQEAESLARQAVRLVPREMLNLRADVLVELAEVLRAAGQENGATEALKAAVRLYKRKGNRVLSERVAQAVAKRMTPGP